MVGSFNNAAGVLRRLDTTAAAARSPSRAAALRGRHRTCCQAALPSLHLAHVRAAGQAMYSCRSEELFARVPISKFGNEDASCGVAEVYVPARPARTEAAARVGESALRGTCAVHSRTAFLRLRARGGLGWSTP